MFKIIKIYKIIDLEVSYFVCLGLQLVMLRAYFGSVLRGWSSYAQETIWFARNQTRFGYIQDKCLHFILSLHHCYSTMSITLKNDHMTAIFSTHG